MEQDSPFHFARPRKRGSVPLMMIPSEELVVIRQLFNPDTFYVFEKWATNLFIYTIYKNLTVELRHKNPREASFTQSYFKTERTVEQLREGQI